MRIRIEVRPDRRRFTAAETYVLASRRSTWRLLALSPIAVGVLLLFGGARAWVFGAALIAVGVLEATLVPWLLPRVGVPAPIREARHPQVVELHDDGLRCEAGGYELHQPWSTFQRVVELPDQYLLLVSDRHYVSVPTAGLSDDQRADVHALLGHRVPAVTR